MTWLGRERAELKVKDLLRRMFGPKSRKLNAAQGCSAWRALSSRLLRWRARPSSVPAPHLSPLTATAHGAAAESLPILDTLRVDLPENENAGLVWIHDEVTYEHDYQSSQFFRREFVRPAYVNPQKLHRPALPIAPVPVRVIPQLMSVRACSPTCW